MTHVPRANTRNLNVAVTCPLTHAHRQKRARKMKVEVVCVLAVTALVLGGVAAGKDQELRIGVKKRPDTCDVRSKSGDRLSMHYTVGSSLLAASAVLYAL